DRVGAQGASVSGGGGVRAFGDVAGGGEASRFILGHQADQEGPVGRGGEAEASRAGNSCVFRRLIGDAGELQHVVDRAAADRAQGGGEVEGASSGWQARLREVEEVRLAR